MLYRIVNRLDLPLLHSVNSLQYPQILYTFSFIDYLRNSVGTLLFDTRNIFNVVKMASSRRADARIFRAYMHILRAYVSYILCESYVCINVRSLLQFKKSFSFFLETVTMIKLRTRHVR
ncbi:uncharacterized protein LOC143150747 isoform X1 [Ptiloglossa arizonensis]|uniref:uncharacterized protein LOC143150747 isoform X1 n=1 Tax=Ptiloglossa arizonensis TaxID=3350558 RepID=UPI003FA05350